MKRSPYFFSKFFLFLFLFLRYPYLSTLSFYMVSIKQIFNMLQWTTSWTRVDKFLATFWHKSLLNSLYNCAICTHISITFYGLKSKSFSFKYFQRKTSHRLKSWFKRDQRNPPDGAVNNDGTYTVTECLSKKNLVHSYLYELMPDIE